MFHSIKLLLPLLVVSANGSTGICECKKNKMGMEYNGHRHTTLSGYTCQRWDSQTPHSHDKNDVTIFPNAVNNEENYCRNPDGRVGGPWCYTTDPDMKSEWCDIPFCSRSNVDCKVNKEGLDYDGSISWTEDGEICQRWDSQTPHSHDKNDVDKYPNAVNNKDNYCRNPDERENGPWCFTMNPDVKNGFCDIAICSARKKCRDNNKGLRYNGTLSETISGITCQRWDAQTPHEHDSNDEDIYRYSVHNEENYCRNPDEREKGPWCYTTDPSVRSEYCDVPYCSFRFAHSYGNSMVLQRSPARAVVWGYAQCEGTTVAVTMGADTYRATSYIGAEGLPIWRVELLPQDAGGPFTIEATSDGYTVAIDDVMFGDVYICSGQSNMAFKMNQLDLPDPDIVDSLRYPNVRTFRSNRIFSKTLLYDFGPDGVSQSWAKPDGGKNIGSFSAVCWLFGRDLNHYLGVPIGLMQSAYPGTKIEAWTPEEGLLACRPEWIYNKNEDSVLWNAMIHPLLNHVIYGVIWYQGESNTANAHKYSCAIKAMVADWRSNWLENTGQTDPVFPFGQVQLAPANDSAKYVGMTYMRWAQTYRMGYTPNSEMERIYTAIAIDLPDLDSPYGSIHPRYKRPVAKRLYYGALQVGYGITSEGPFQGPIPTRVNVGDTIRVTYDDGQATLEQRATDGFQVCCADSADYKCALDGVWTNTTIISTEGSEVTLDNPCQCPDVAKRLRYLWQRAPCLLKKCPIYRVGNELPAPPYITDL